MDGWTLVNAHHLVDVKDAGPIARFHEASRIVDMGRKAVFEALSNGGREHLTETVVGGIAALAMR